MNYVEYNSNTPEEEIYEFLKIIGRRPDYEQFPHIGDCSGVPCPNCGMPALRRRIDIEKDVVLEQQLGQIVTFCIECQQCNMKLSLIREWFSSPKEQEEKMGSPSCANRGPDKSKMQKKVEAITDRCPRCEKMSLKTVSYLLNGEFHHSEFHCIECGYEREML